MRTTALHGFIKAMALTVHSEQQAQVAIRYIKLASRQVFAARVHQQLPPILCASMEAKLQLRHATLCHLIMRRQAEQFLPFRQPAA